MLLDVTADFPQLILNASRVGQFYIVEQLIGDQIGDQLDIFQRHTARHQLVQDNGHFLFGKSTAFQQDFAYSQNFTVCHQWRRTAHQPESFLLAVINDLPVFSLGNIALCKKGSNIV